MMTRFGQKQLIDYEKVVVKQTEPVNKKQLQQTALAAEQAERAAEQADRLDRTFQKNVQPRLSQMEKAVTAQQRALAERLDVDKNLKAAAQATQQAAESAVATQQTKQNLHNAVTEAVKEVKTGAKEGIKDTAQQWANGFEQMAKSLSFRLRNPMSTGPATRAEKIMGNAFWTAAGTGGITHQVAKLALDHGPDKAAPHLSGFLHGLNGLEPNVQGAAIGGALGLAAGVTAWLTGLGTSKGRDRVDYALAKTGKIKYARLDADTPMGWENRASLANNAEHFAKLVKENPEKAVDKLTQKKA